MSTKGILERVWNFLVKVLENLLEPGWEVVNTPPPHRATKPPGNKRPLYVGQYTEKFCSKFESIEEMEDSEEGL